MRIIISPWSQKLKNNKENPKNYPYWSELVALLKGNQITQVGRSGEKVIEGVDNVEFDLPFDDLKKLLLASSTFFSVDNFFPHFANFYGKYGVVLFSKSDPKIFGYSDNLNLYKSSDYFRKDQFGLWTECEYDEDAFVKPEKVIEAMLTLNNV